MDRDDREGRREGVVAIGALHDRNAEQHRVGEQRAEADRHGLPGAAMEDAPGAEDPAGEGEDGAGVEGEKQPRIEDRPEVEVDRARGRAGTGTAKVWV